MTASEELRLECLRLSQAANGVPAETSDVVERARAYADFVAGRNDAEIIGAVHELARRVTV